MPYKNKEKQKEYYQRNKDKIKKRSLENYNKNIDKIKIQNRERYLKNRVLTGDGKGHKKGKMFKKGFTPWNKGLKGVQTAWNKGLKNWMSVEAMASATLKRIGKTAWNKGLPNIGSRGENHYNWKGGVSPVNDIIRKSLNYKEWRKECLLRDNFTCQKTGQHGGDLVVHHINNFSEFPELRFEISNGITLSKSAHKEFHKKYGYRNNTMEQLIKYLKEDLMFNPSNDYIVKV